MVEVKSALLRGPGRTTLKREICHVHEKNENEKLTVITPSHANDFSALNLYFMRCENIDCTHVHEPASFIKVSIIKLARTADELLKSSKRLRYPKMPALESSDPEVAPKRKRKNAESKDTGTVGKKKPKRVRKNFF